MLFFCFPFEIKKNKIKNKKKLKTYNNNKQTKKNCKKLKKTLKNKEK